jgi:hypothetical protein
VNSSGESPKSAAAFAFASSHYSLSLFGSTVLSSIAASTKHYYRFAVSAGFSYTIVWEDGSNQNLSNSVWATAWQNDGTQIFSARNGYTDPRLFTATSAGYVTVEVNNTNTSTSYNYKVYYY